MTWNSFYFYDVVKHILILRYIFPIQSGIVSGRYSVSHYLPLPLESLLCMLIEWMSVNCKIMPSLHRNMEDRTFFIWEAAWFSFFFFVFCQEDCASNQIFIIFTKFSKHVTPSENHTHYNKINIRWVYLANHISFPCRFISVQYFGIYLYLNIYYVYPSNAQCCESNIFGQNSLRRLHGGAALTYSILIYKRSFKVFKLQFH